jgi:outer membrane protein assembly factor BamE (lipoprotein component of BamABCDE complex)
MTRQSVGRRVVLCVILCAICSGCTIIPTNFHTSDSRTNVREETIATINPGQTTKEDVFLALGEPDAVLSDGLVYHWSKIKAVVGFAYSHDKMLIKEYYLFITFDERGVVMHREVRSWWRSKRL